MKRKIFLIAEAGVNHNGNMVMAKKLIDVAKWAGADAVKFQTFSPEEITTKQMGKANYQSKNYKKYKTQIQMLKKFYLVVCKLHIQYHFLQMELILNYLVKILI